MIIVAGDSWGCGEWVLDQSGNTVMAHGGIAQYLREQDQDVINISQAAQSNWQILQCLTSLLNNQTYSKNNHAQGYHIVGNKQQPWNISDIDLIVVFQTEWFRDFRVVTSTPHAVPQFLLPVDYRSELQYEIMSQWQHRLSELACKFQVPIKLVGGGSDCNWFDDFEKDHPGLSIVCQSLTNLCVNNNHRINQPVFGCYNYRILQQCKHKAIDDQALQFLLEQVELGMSRKKVWENNINWFSDAVHGNRAAHKKLLDLIFK